MPKLKQFESQWTYFARYNEQSTKSNFEKYKVVVSDYNEVLNQLKLAISEKNSSLLEQLLKQEYINPKVEKIETQITHNSFSNTCNPHDTFGYRFTKDLNGKTKTRSFLNTGQMDTYTYELHWVSEVLEELLRNHKDDFIELLNISESPLRRAFFDFANIDLNGTDLSDLYLPKDLLEKYKKETIWTRNKEKLVFSAIDQLEHYAYTLGRKSTHSAKQKSTQILELTKALKKKIDSTSNHNQKFQEELLQELHSKDSLILMQRDGGLKTFLVNLSLAILGVGLIYLLAVGIHYSLTGEFWFANHTISEHHLIEVEQTMRANL